MSDYGELLGRLEAATGPDRNVDFALWDQLSRPLMSLEPPHYTRSLDAAVALTEQMLPGWAWRVATCHVSDDAWVMPDFNNPTNGEYLLSIWPEEGKVDALGWLDSDIDQRPPGRPAIALLRSMLVGLAALRKLEARASS